MAFSLKSLLVVLMLLCVSCGAALAGEADVAGLWRGSLYGSDLQAHVEQDGHNVKAEVVVHALTGETNVYMWWARYLTAICTCCTVAATCSRATPRATPSAAC